MRPHTVALFTLVASLSVGSGFAYGIGRRDHDNSHLRRSLQNRAIALPDLFSDDTLDALIDSVEVTTQSLTTSPTPTLIPSKSLTTTLNSLTLSSSSLPSSTPSNTTSTLATASISPSISSSVSRTSIATATSDTDTSTRTRTRAPAPSPTMSPEELNKTLYSISHNTVRGRHGADPLVWSDELASHAREWANQCVLKDSGGRFGQFGENIVAGSGSFSPSAAVHVWYEERGEYDPLKPIASHFTQMVWKSSKNFGCAVATCKGLFPDKTQEAQMHVCFYDPPGNVSGMFEANVQAP